MKRMNEITKKLLRKASESQTLLAGLLLLLVPLLAALQYHWLGQISEGERRQMLVRIRTAALGFGEDFNHEITIAYAIFLTNFAGATTPIEEQAQRSYDAWQTVSRYPQIIKTVYQVSANPQRQELRLFHFNPASRSMVLSEWPDEMTDLRTKVKEGIAHLIEETYLREGAFYLDKTQRLMIIEASTPALLIPQPEPLKLVGENQFSVTPPLNFIVAVLDREYLTREFLPMLAQRHFGRDAESACELTIYDDAMKRSLFQSAAKPVTEADADFSFHFFSSLESRPLPLKRCREPKRKVRRE